MLEILLLVLHHRGFYEFESCAALGCFVVTGRNVLAHEFLLLELLELAREGAGRYAGKLAFELAEALRARYKRMHDEHGPGVGEKLCHLRDGAGRLEGFHNDCIIPHDMSTLQSKVLSGTLSTYYSFHTHELRYPR